MNKEFLHMQKLAGLITESEYQANIQENLNDLKVKWVKNDLEKYYEKGLADDFETVNGNKVKEIVGYYDEDGSEEFDVIGYIFSPSGQDIESYSEDELDDSFMNALK